MKTKNMKVIRVMVLAAGFIAVLSLIAEARTVKLTCDGQRSITAAVERLKPGDTLLVEGGMCRKRGDTGESGRCSCSWPRRGNY